jgi:hypothetical protein
MTDKQTDFIATAKAQNDKGVPYSGSTVENKITPTPNSKLSANDGKLGGDNSPNGRQGWADMKATTADNTYTSKGGSRRG